jgi:hypothetical protein
MVFDYLDIVDRAMTGEMVDEHERDMSLFRKVTKLVQLASYKNLHNRFEDLGFPF